MNELELLEELNNIEETLCCDDELPEYTKFRFELRKKEIEKLLSRPNQLSK